MSNIIDQLESEQLKDDVQDFGPGDQVRVQVRVKEGDRERLQAYEGVVIAKKNRGLNSSFTVRKVANGEGVERVFQTHSPLIADIAVVRRGDVRRAKTDTDNVINAVLDGGAGTIHYATSSTLMCKTSCTAFAMI